MPAQELGWGSWDSDTASSNNIEIQGDTFTLAEAASAIPDSDVYLHDDWGDNKLTNRDDSGTTTHNGVTGYYRPEWTTRSGSPTAANEMLELPDAGNLTADINLDLSSQITWDYTGVDVSESSDANNIFGVGLWGGATTINAGRPEDAIFVEVRPTGTVALHDANFNEIVEASSPPTGSPMDITVIRSSGGTFELLINGSSIGTGTASVTPSSVSYLNIGRRTDETPSYYLDGVKVSLGLYSALWASWTKDSANNPVLSPSSSGWDNDDVLDPALEEASDGTYHMIYRGNDGSTYRLGHATSTDLVSWTKDSANPIIDTGSSGSWDDTHIRGGTELLTDSDGTHHLFYRGFDGSTYQIGHATSTDWSSWTKDSNNPVLSPSSSGWDSDSISDISVVKYDGTWHAIYQGYDGSENRFGHATSSDLSSWTKDDSNNPVFTGGAAYDPSGVQSPAVRLVDGTFEMLYNAVDSTVSPDDRVTAYAYSDDLINWKKSTDKPVLEESSSGWDSTQLRAVGTIHDGSKWVHLYTGYDGSTFQIGKADAQ